MITKLKSKGFFLSSTLALGVAAGVGIATAPAQASTLEWDNGTDSFIQDFIVGGNNAPPVDAFADVFLPDEFDVTFSPASLGGQAAVFIASGEFDPFFPTPPAFVDVTADASFSFSGGNAASNFFYTLDNALNFNFGNGVVVTYGAGSTFEGEFDIDLDTNLVEGIEFQAFNLTGEQVVINGETFLPGEPNGNTLDGIEITFGQAVGAVEGGGYQAEVVASTGVPEPATILGLLAVGGLGLGLKRKK